MTWQSDDICLCVHQANLASTPAGSADATKETFAFHGKPMSGAHPKSHIFSRPSLALDLGSPPASEYVANRRIAIAIRVAVCRSNESNTEPRDSPNDPYSSPPGGFPSAFNRGCPIEPPIEMSSRVHTRTVRRVPKGHAESEREPENERRRNPSEHPIC